MASDLRWHPGRPGGEISERGAVGPSLGQPRQNKKVNRHSQRGSEQVRADNLCGEEQSRLSEQSHHCHHHPSPLRAPPTLVFSKNLASPKWVMR